MYLQILTTTTKRLYKIQNILLASYLKTLILENESSHSEFFFQVTFLNLKGFSFVITAMSADKKTSARRDL
jgi:hypothetical protein